MEDKDSQSGDAAATIFPRRPHDPRTRSDDEASLDLPVDTAVFRLLAFPTEIVRNIFEGLVPAPLATGTGLPLPTDIVASQKALVNLCKVSKFCNEIALLLMYKNIIITDRVQMKNVLAHLVAHQDRCAWIRSVAVPTDLVFQDYSERDGQAALTLYRCSLGIHKVRDQPQALLQVMDDATRLMHQSSDDLEEWGSIGLVQSWRPRWFYLQLLRIMLYLGNHIEDLLITAPNAWHSLDNLYYRRDCLGHPVDITPGQYSATKTDPAVVGNIFKALRRVRTQPDPHDDFGFEPIPLALEFVKCREWEFLYDDGCWFSLLDFSEGHLDHRQPSKYLVVLSHITGLSLQDSETTLATAWNHEFAAYALTEEEVGATLQQALEEVRDTLTDLRLGWAPWGEVLTEEDQAAVAPHSVDVSHFPRLKRSEIDAPFVYEGEELTDGDITGDNLHAE